MGRQRFPTPNGPYTPHNYEGDYKGTMTLLDAHLQGVAQYSGAEAGRDSVGIQAR